jgi:hypothetical protein
MENVLEVDESLSSQAVNAVLANRASDSANNRFRPFISIVLISFISLFNSQQGAENKSDLANFLNIYAPYVNRSFFEHCFIFSTLCLFMHTGFALDFVF